MVLEHLLLKCTNGRVVLLIPKYPPDCPDLLHRCVTLFSWLLALLEHFFNSGRVNNQVNASNTRDTVGPVGFPPNTPRGQGRGNGVEDTRIATVPCIGIDTGTMC